MYYNENMLLLLKGCLVLLIALTVVSDEGSSNPLTVPPSPDRQALKHQQAAEKTTARNGEGKLLRKARELREKEKTNKRVNSC